METFFNKPTHFSSTSQPAALDHIMTTHPQFLSQAETTRHSESDHCYLTVRRNTKKVIRPPRYRIVRNYKQMNKEEFRTILYTSSLTEEADMTQDLDRCTELLTQAVTEALDFTAPARRVQTKKVRPDFRTAATKIIIGRRDIIQVKAHTTNLIEDWREFRLIRNHTRREIKKRSKGPHSQPFRREKLNKHVESSPTTFG